MKKAICFVAMLGLVATASADINLFATAGSEYAAMTGNVFNTDEIDFLPDFAGVGGTMNPSLDTTGGLTETIYFWGQFDGEAAYTQIYGMHFNLALDGGTIDQSVLYRHNKTSGPPSARWDRWDNADPLTMLGDPAAAVTSDGIMDSFMDYDLGDGQTFLIGAAEVTVPDGYVGSLELALDTLGLIAYDGNTGDPSRPTINIMGDDTVTPDNPPSAATYNGVVNFVPEPASLLLIGLGALALRRR